MDDDAFELTVILVFVAAGIVMYLLPVWLAFRRRHRKRVAIAAVVLLLGWTGIGWIVGLAWAIRGLQSTARGGLHDPDSHRVLPRDIADRLEDARDDAEPYFGENSASDDTADSSTSDDC